MTVNHTPHYLPIKREKMNMMMVIVLLTLPLLLQKMISQSYDDQKERRGK